MLETERLRIQEYTAEDLENRHRLMAEAFGESGSLEDTRQWLIWTLANYRELARLHQPPYGDYAIALRSSGEIIGSVGLVPLIVPWNSLLDPTPPPHYFTSPEFGLFWAVFPAHRARGYASEAGRAMLKFVFESLRARRVVATTEFENEASQQVMRKLGMKLLHNNSGDPFWCQIVGVLDNPAASSDSPS
jgi:ribosomal-protein-alanine N-acetyltransferase